MLSTRLDCIIKYKIEKFAVVQLDKYVGKVLSADYPCSSSSIVGSSSSPSSKMDLIPINHLTPAVPRWTIKALVTTKTLKTKFNTGDGEYFSMTLRDNSGAIRAVAFNAECEKFYHEIEVGKEYYISGAKVKDVRPQFRDKSPLKNNYEITFTKDTSITPLEGVQGKTPALRSETGWISDLQRRIDRDTAAQSQQESSSSKDFLQPYPGALDDEFDEEDTGAAELTTASSQGPTAQNAFRIELMQKEHELRMKVLQETMELKRKKSNLKIQLLERQQKHEAEIFEIKKAKLQKAE